MKERMDFFVKKLKSKLKGGDSIKYFNFHEIMKNSRLTFTTKES